MLDLPKRKVKVRITGTILVLLLWTSLSAAAFMSCVKSTETRLPVFSDYETPDTAEARKNLKIGVVPGPYGDLYLEAIQPLLKEKSYSAELVFYNDFIRPNHALAEKETDLNIFQHYRYLNDFKTQNNLSITAITEIPTVSMGIFSRRYNSLNGLGNGISASIPNDATNRSRALRVLDAANVVKLNPASDATRADLDDIISNPREIRFIQMDAQNLVGSLDSADISVINGNFAIAGGLNPSDSLYNEILDEGYVNVIAVRTEDLDQQFVRDIVDTVRSMEYVTMVTDPNGSYSGFQHPRYFFNIKE